MFEGNDSLPDGTPCYNPVRDPYRVAMTDRNMATVDGGDLDGVTDFLADLGWQGLAEHVEELTGDTGWYAELIFSGNHDAFEIGVKVGQLLAAQGRPFDFGDEG